MAKDAITWDFEIATIDEKFSAHPPLIKWAHTTLEAPHRAFLKNTYQASLFNELLNLNQYKELYHTFTNNSINWDISTQFVHTFNSDSLSTSFGDSAVKAFKIKTLSLTLPSLEILKTRYPHLYNNYEWTCPNTFSTTDFYGNPCIQRCPSKETQPHMWLCPHIRSITQDIIDLTILHLCAKVRTINPEAATKLLQQDLLHLDCFNLNENSKCNFSVTTL